MPFLYSPSNLLSNLASHCTNQYFSIHSLTYCLPQNIFSLTFLQFIAFHYTNQHLLTYQPSRQYLFGFSSIQLILANILFKWLILKLGVQLANLLSSLRCNVIHLFVFVKSHYEQDQA